MGNLKRQLVVSKNYRISFLKVPKFSKNSAMCMYVCMHACMHACMHVCTYVCMYVCMCVYVCICVCMYVCVCMCVYECMNVCMYVSMYVYRHRLHKTKFCNLDCYMISLCIHIHLRRICSILTSVPGFATLGPRLLP